MGEKWIFLSLPAEEKRKHAEQVQKPWERPGLLGGLDAGIHVEVESVRVDEMHASKHCNNGTAQARLLRCISGASPVVSYFSAHIKALLLGRSGETLLPKAACEPWN